MREVIEEYGETIYTFLIMTGLVSMFYRLFDLAAKGMLSSF